MSCFEDLEQSPQGESCCKTGCSEEQLLAPGASVTGRETHCWICYSWEQKQAVKSKILQQCVPVCKTLLVSCWYQPATWSREWHPCPWKGIGTKWSLKSLLAQTIPWFCWHGLWFRAWPSTCGVWWEYKVHHTALKTWVGSTSVHAWLVWRPQARVLPCFSKYSSHQGMALFFYLFWLLLAHFSSVKIAQVPKLLKENELFIRHTSVNLLVKWLIRQVMVHSEDGVKPFLWDGSSGGWRQLPWPYI